MSMTGVIANTLTVIIGSFIGLAFRKGIPEKVTSAVMTGLGLCTIYIGIDGALSGNNVLIVIASMVTGSIIGTLIDIDHAINRLGEWVERRFPRKRRKGLHRRGLRDGKSSVLCWRNDHQRLPERGNFRRQQPFVHQIHAGSFSSSMLAASLGIGVMFAAAFVLGFQGLLVLLAGFLAPVLTESAIAEMTCAGSLIIIAIGTNLIGVTKIKVANYLPAIAIAPLLCRLVSLIA